MVAEMLVIWRQLGPCRRQILDRSSISKPLPLTEFLRDCDNS